LKLTEIHQDDPLILLLVNRLLAKHTPVMYQDMGDVIDITYGNTADDVRVNYRDWDGHLHTDRMTCQQLEAFQLVPLKYHERKIVYWRMQ
jgi:hypothetical protein